METEIHPFPPFIPDSPRILILGTFPPKSKRWAFEFYYPNPTNDMWRVMGLVFFGNKNYFYDAENRIFRLNSIKKFLNDERIALSDTGVEVVRLKGNASDKFLDIRRPIDLHSFFDGYPTLAGLVTTGEKAASVVAELTGTEVPKMGESICFEYDGRKIRHFRMPSTSRAYPLALEKKAAMYATVFAALDDAIK